MGVQDSEGTGDTTTRKGYRVNAGQGGNQRQCRTERETGSLQDREGTRDNVRQRSRERLGMCKTGREPETTQAAFHMGPSWAPAGPSWAPVGPQLGLAGAHLGMLLGNVRQISRSRLGLCKTGREPETM